MIEFVMLFGVCLLFWWFAGRVIDDVLDQAEMDMAWWRALAHEDLSRRDDEGRAA